MNQPSMQLQGIIDAVYDARAMSVNGTRIGAPWQKTLADVTTGGGLAVGATVLVTYTTRESKGKVYQNASAIQVLAAGAAQPAAQAAATPAAQAYAGTAAPPAKPHHAKRTNPQYRSADEMARGAAVEAAIKLVQADDVSGMFKLADLIFAYTTETVSAAQIIEHLSPAEVVVNPTPAPSQPADVATTAQPTQEAPAPAGPTPEALAALAAAESAAAEGAAAGNALDAFMQGN